MAVKVTWEVSDGYVGGARPHTFEIDDCDVEDCEDLEEFEALVYDMLDCDFQQKATPEISSVSGLPERFKDADL